MLQGETDIGASQFGQADLETLSALLGGADKGFIEPLKASKGQGKIGGSPARGGGGRAQAVKPSATAPRGPPR